jgi:hypothetical protein
MSKREGCRGEIHWVKRRGGGTGYGAVLKSISGDERKLKHEIGKLEGQVRHKIAKARRMAQ